MINIKHTGQAGFVSKLMALDAMLHAPAYGHQRAFHTRKQISCANMLTGRVDCFEYSVPVRYRRGSSGRSYGRNTSCTTSQESVLAGG